jgi:ribonucleoside-diphosphate reductase alpha chain
VAGGKVKLINYSNLRKDLQSKGEIPEWFTTAGTQLFYEKYSYQNETVKSRFKSVAKAMAQHAPKVYPSWWETDKYTCGKTWEEVFFSTLWDGYISCSTPMLANAGIRKRGTTVSCAGGYVGNNLFDRYNAITEAAVLTKHSHGTSYSVDHWPAEGDKLKRGGRSLGVMPVVRDFITAMEEVTQGSRRGSLAYSIRPQHGDFEKVLKHLYERTESNNVGWLIDDDFNREMDEEGSDAEVKFGKMLGIKMPRGKGYFTFISKMNRHLAEAFRRKGMTVKASNLCQETCLPSDENYTFSCVILNYNLELWDNWPEHLVFIGQVMADCNISEYLATMDEMTPMDRQAMQKIYRFTKEFRSLGSGVLGWHTLMQMKKYSVSSLDCMFLNTKIFKHLDDESKAATQWLAGVLGEPEGCKGLGIRNATRLMMPPTKSTAELMAGASEGIGLDTAMAFTKQSAGGEFFRVNKVLVKWIKEKGLDFDSCVKDIIANKGSVQKVDWLDDEEKAAMRTGFEIPMEDYLRLCSQRQKYIDQAQSINLYFTSNDSEEYIGKIHRLAFKDEGILSLYYIYSMRGAGDISRIEVCEMCQ